MKCELRCHRMTQMQSTLALNAHQTRKGYRTQVLTICGVFLNTRRPQM